MEKNLPVENVIALLQLTLTMSRHARNQKYAAFYSKVKEEEIIIDLYSLSENLL